jgi:hypothetical protein
MYCLVEHSAYIFLLKSLLSLALFYILLLKCTRMCVFFILLFILQKRHILHYFVVNHTSWINILNLFTLQDVNSLQTRESR